jgi:hypothetical protein
MESCSSLHSIWALEKQRFSTVFNTDFGVTPRDSEWLLKSREPESSEPIWALPAPAMAEFSTLAMSCHEIVEKGVHLWGEWEAGKPRCVSMCFASTLVILSSPYRTSCSMIEGYRRRVLYLRINMTYML